MANYHVLTPPMSGGESPQQNFTGLASPPSQQSYTFTVTVGDGLEDQVTLLDPMEIEPEPYLEFIMQPTDKFRFRYISEMAGTHGSLTGASSVEGRKQSFPTVTLRNWSKRAIIRCSIYQINEKGKEHEHFKPHAHRLVMKKGKEEVDDPHDITVSPGGTYEAKFAGMGIVHTPKKNLVSELERKITKLLKEEIARKEGIVRELTAKELVEIKGLAESESKSINLNIVCLRFDAFEKTNDGILHPICQPIFSQGINNLKSCLTGDLKIVRLDRLVSPAKGGKEVFILVERVAKKNIRVRVFETNDKNEVVWEDYGRFNELDVHHQYAIVFKTPPYKDDSIKGPVKVFIQLERPSDGARSDPREFRYIPNKFEPGVGQKRRRCDVDYSDSSSFESGGRGSAGLPVILQQANDQQMDLPEDSLPKITDEILSRALKNVDSKEMDDIYDMFGPGFNRLLEDEGDESPQLSLTVFDAPLEHKMKGPSVRMQHRCNVSSPVVKLEVTDEEIAMADRAKEEISRLLKVKNVPKQEIECMLRAKFEKDLTTNALHVFISQNRIRDAFAVLKLIFSCSGSSRLMNVRNRDGRTYLHLAVASHNGTLVKWLMHFWARVAPVDNDLRTPLHTAVAANAAGDVLQMLLADRSHETVGDYVHLEDSNGNTALYLAVEKRNMPAVKLLCKDGVANVNKRHEKNGFVPLRLAIETDYTECVEYLLGVSNMDPNVADHRGVSPLSAALTKEDGNDTKRIVTEYIEKHKILVDKIKEEDDEYDEDTDFEEEVVRVKTETPKEQLEEMYEHLNDFTPDCLDAVSEILDASGKWEDLAELLDIRHVLSMIATGRSVSRDMLTCAVQTSGIKLYEIRNFLEDLDESRAVELMDSMAASRFNQLLV